MQMEHFFSPNSGEDQKKRSSSKLEHFFSQARSQKSAMVGCFGGLGAEPPAAGGQWGSRGEAPAAGG